MRNLGVVRVSPSDYVIRLRNGKIYKQGQGLSFFTVPKEQYVIIPTSVSKILFSADQITKENQGVEVSGFAIWKVDEPAKTYLHFDFSSEKNPIETIDIFLKDVVESAIRHMVANMTIEEVLRKRGTIILQMKKELEYISNEWGISIETIEIKNVKIMSAQLFHNMQAKYRDQIKLESETSALKTAQEIAEHQIKHKEEIALLEQEAKRKELQRKDELDRLEIKRMSTLNELKAEDYKKQQLQAKENEMQLFEKEKELQLKKIASELKTVQAELELTEQQNILKKQEKKGEAVVDRIELELNKERMEVSNLENSTHILYKKLSEIISSLNINELNIGRYELEQLFNHVKTKLKSDKNSSAGFKN